MPATDAQGGETGLGVTALHLVQQGDQDTAAGSAYGVAKSDSAAIDIQLGGIEFQIVADSQGLRGKGLVGPR